MRHILFISYSYWPPNFGGELISCKERFKSLQENGFKVNVLTSGQPGFSLKEEDNGITIHRTPIIHSSRSGRAIRRLIFSLWSIYYILFSRYDFIHFGALSLGAHLNPIYGWVCTLLTKGIRRKKCISVYSLADSERDVIIFKGISGFFRKKFLKNMTSIVAVSPSIYNELKMFFSNVTLLPYGVHDDIFTIPTDERRNNFRTKYKTDEKNIIFTFLGSISKRKGFDLLSIAFQQLSDKYPNWILWIIGPVTKSENQNIDEIEVNKIIGPLLKVQDKVKYWGRIDDRSKLAEIIGSSDIFVFPSIIEGMGIAPMEAMSTGVPPIISRIKGITDVASIEGQTGLYIKPGDLDDLKKAMIKLGSDPDLRKQMGIKAAKRIREEFRWDLYIDKWIKIYS